MKKTLVVLLSSLLFFSIYSYSKTENLGKLAETVEKKETTVKKSDPESSTPTQTKIYCNYDLEGVWGGNNSYVQCKCKDCTMFLEKTAVKSGEKDITELEGAEIEVPYLKDFMEFMKDKYSGKNYSIKEITLYDYNADKAVNYYYELEDGSLDDIVFARKDGETISINCDGSCDCRLQYIYSDLPKTACSCADCVMEVTKVKSKYIQKK